MYNRDVVKKGNYQLNKVAKEVRKTIKRLGGTMPEDFPTPKKSLKEIRRSNNKNISKNIK